MSNVESMRRALVEEARVSDMLFEKTGIEEERLLRTIEEQRLNDDPEFKRLSQEYI